MVKAKRNSSILPNDLIRTKEVAGIFKVAYNTVSGWRYRKIGPGYWKIGGEYWYSKREVLNFLQNARINHEVDDG